MCHNMEAPPLPARHVWCQPHTYLQPGGRIPCTLDTVSRGTNAQASSRFAPCEIRLRPTAHMQLEQNFWKCARYHGRQSAQHARPTRDAAFELGDKGPAADGGDSNDMDHKAAAKSASFTSLAPSGRLLWDTATEPRVGMPDCCRKRCWCQVQLSITPSNSPMPQVDVQLPQFKAPAPVSARLLRPNSLPQNLYLRPTSS